MPRVQPLAPEDASDEIRASYEYLEKRYGKLLEPITVAAHNPEILKAYQSFERGFQKANAIDRKLRELAVLKAATLMGCAFCIDFGSHESFELGVTREQLMSLHEHRTSPAFSALERLVLDYAVAMSETPPTVDDDLFGRIRAEFDDDQIVELTAAIAWENYRSRFNRTLGMTSHGFADAGACALPAHPPAS
jgi:AhpD family alkylhydroperoxidase